MPATYTDEDVKRSYAISSPNSLADEPYRQEFQRDYARVLHSASFRRLQGKTQLFPTLESDFFRSRLTHSLEVSQIATSIARQINYSDPHFNTAPIDTDLVSLASLSHDIGHAPFGHNGEAVLDERMQTRGGFEGNAQTLRILSRIEKKCFGEGAEPLGILDGRDRRFGLGLTYRSYASVLKYDRIVPKSRDEKDAPLAKGYYDSDSDFVQEIREHVGVSHTGDLRTIECSIMDLADDIAYSTYDLEDALKGRFVTSLDLISPSDELLDKAAEGINKKRTNASAIERVQVAEVLYDLFASYLLEQDSLDLPDQIDTKDPRRLAAHVANIYHGSKNLSESSYYRTQFTSYLVGRFIREVNLTFDPESPALSTVEFTEDVALQVEVLKQFTYSALILSPQFRVVAHRCQEIVGRIFDSLADPNSKGPDLLPPDVKALYYAFDDGDDKRRVVCDYVAGMTDRYALEFYGRLFSENPETIFKPF